MFHAFPLKLPSMPREHAGSTIVGNIGNSGLGSEMLVWISGAGELQERLEAGCVSQEMLLCPCGRKCLWWGSPGWMLLQPAPVSLEKGALCLDRMIAYDPFGLF